MEKARSSRATRGLGERAGYVGEEREGDDGSVADLRPGSGGDSSGEEEGGEEGEEMEIGKFGLLSAKQKERSTEADLPSLCLPFPSSSRGSSRHQGSFRSNRGSY